MAGAASGVTILAPQFDVHVLWVPPITCDATNELTPTVTAARMMRRPAATAICEPPTLRTPIAWRGGAAG